MKSKPTTIQFSHLNQNLKISLRDWKLEVQKDHKCPFPEELLATENKTLIQNL